MRDVRLVWILLVVVMVGAVGCGSRSRRVGSGDGGADSDADSDADGDGDGDSDGEGTDSDVDGDTDQDVDTDVDTDTDVDSDADADADQDPDIYPCEVDRDCVEWWPGSGVFCLEGFCCFGEDVDGECRCGDRVGTCPPLTGACCETRESPDRKVCTDSVMCLGGDL